MKPMKPMKTTYTNLLWLCIFLVFCQCKDQPSKQVKQIEKTELDKLSEQIQKNPNSDKLYFLRAQESLKSGTVQQAIADLNKAIELNSSNSGYYHQLSELYLESGQPENAIQIIEKAASSFPDSIATIIKLAKTQLILKIHDACFLTVERILKMEGDNEEAFYIKGSNHQAISQLDQALKAYERATKLNSQYVDAWISSAEVLALQDSAEALEYFDKAIGIDRSNPKSYNAKAQYLQNKGKPLKAIALYKHINSISPSYVDAYLNAGKIYWDLKAFTQAKEQYQLLTSLDPKNHIPHYYLGLIDEKSGYYPSAVEHLQKAINLKPDFDKAIISLKSLQEEIKLLQEERKNQ